jgi:hypothetical protein
VVVRIEELAVLGQRELEQLHPLEVLLRAEQAPARDASTSSIVSRTVEPSGDNCTA